MQVTDTAARVLWVGLRGPGEALAVALHDHGYRLLHVEPDASAFTACRRLRHDAIVLAQEAVEVDALLDAVRRWRRRGESAALLVLATRCAPLDEVALLGAGADAVVDRADGMLVLLARLRRWLQRTAPARVAAVPLRVGSLEVDGDHCCVRAGGRVLSLGASATGLVHELAASDGRPVARSDLARRLGPAAAGPHPRTVDTAISRLRHALHEQGVRDIAIEAVRGRGYRLVPSAATPGGAPSARAWA